MQLWGKILAVVLVLSFAGVSEAKAAKTGKKDSKAVRGTITAIAADGSSVTVDVAKKKKAGAAPMPKVFTTSAGTRVTIDGVPGKKVVDLSVGQKVKVTASRNGAASAIATDGAAGKGKKKKKA